MRRIREPRRVGSYVIVAVVLLVYVFPLAFLVNTALKSDNEFITNPVGLVTSPRFANFLDAWNEGHFGAYILNSALYTAVAALIGTIISLVLAFPVSRGYLRGSNWWNVLFVVILFLPNSLITQFQLLLNIHLYNTQLGYILIMAAGIGVGPLLLRAFFTSIPIELDEAAALDGISYWRYLVGFVIPLARPALATVFILQAINVWNDIILATVLLPDQTKSPITLGLFNFQGTYSNEWGLLAAATLIVAAPLIIAYVFLQRFIVGGVVAGAVKG
ncbi:MAG TPA: carbohydrate ABC transporter permease [Galbitalea sp.]|nr:carbohydrate ABC transporter permease [Galbitalea sp.]